MDFDRLRVLAGRFRGAMAEAHEAGELAHFVTEAFPDGYCGVATEFMCRFLRDRGFGTWNRVTGGLPDGTSSHAWAESGSHTIVDVTADQFVGRPAAFVGPADDWYRGMTDVVCVTAVEVGDDPAAWQTAYAAVVRRIP